MTSLEKLMTKYADSAALHGKAIEAGDPERANAAFSAEIVIGEWEKGTLQVPV